jgi:hypothetical protein
MVWAPGERHSRLEVAPPRGRTSAARWLPLAAARRLLSGWWARSPHVPRASTRQGRTPPRERRRGPPLEAPRRLGSRPRDGRARGAPGTATSGSPRGSGPAPRRPGAGPGHPQRLDAERIVLLRERASREHPRLALDDGPHGRAEHRRAAVPPNRRIAAPPRRALDASMRGRGPRPCGPSRRDCVLAARRALGARGGRGAPWPSARRLAEDTRRHVEGGERSGRPRPARRVPRSDGSTGC